MYGFPYPRGGEFDSFNISFEGGGGERGEEGGETGEEETDEEKRREKVYQADSAVYITRRFGM